MVSPLFWCSSNRTVEKHSLCKSWASLPRRSVSLWAKVWVTCSMLPQRLPPDTMEKKLCSNMVPQGAEGYSAEWTKPRVPPIRVFVWLSKPGQTNVWVGDSSSAACQMWVTALRVKLLSQQAGPAILKSSSLQSHVAREEVSILDTELLLRPRSERNEDQLVEFHPCARLTFLLHSLVSILCLSFPPASHSALITNPTRPDPEGESSPPTTDNTERMASPARKDTDWRLTTPTKSDVISRSPGSPASPIPKLKSGKGKRKRHL